MDKNQLRQQAKDIRAGISDKQRAVDEALLKNAVIANLGEAIHCIGTYHAIGTEISPLCIPREGGYLPDLEKDSRFRGRGSVLQMALPVIRADQSLEFYEWKEGEELVTRDFNIPIPDTRYKAPVNPDVILAPLLLCDLKGNRLGYGKGHYDRYLASLDTKPLLIGICFDEQIYEGTIPAEDHDIKLDMILTPKRTIDLR